MSEEVKGSNLNNKSEASKRKKKRLPRSAKKYYAIKESVSGDPMLFYNATANELKTGYSIVDGSKLEVTKPFSYAIVKSYTVTGSSSSSSSSSSDDDDSSRSKEEVIKDREIRCFRSKEEAMEYLGVSSIDVSECQYRS